MDTLRVETMRVTQGQDKVKELEGLVKEMYDTIRTLQSREADLVTALEQSEKRAMSAESDVSHYRSLLDDVKIQLEDRGREVEKVRMELDAAYGPIAQCQQDTVRARDLAASKDNDISKYKSMLMEVCAFIALMSVS